jgi:acyl-CoA synthetase (AMP-forming)/AMP-acid ligase II
MSTSGFIRNAASRRFTPDWHGFAGSKAVALSHSEGPPLSTTEISREAEVIANFGESRPDRIALILDETRVSYAVLDAQVCAAMAVFAHARLKPGDRIAYLGVNNPIFFAVMLACMRSGIVLIPVNWRLKTREIAYVLRDSDARLILSDAAFLDASREANTAAAPIICIDGTHCDDFPARLADVAVKEGRIDGNWETASLVLYTSGTTGNPKGVQISEQALALARQMERDGGGFDDWGDDEVLLSPLPLFHIGGISWALCGLNRGGTVVFTTDMSSAALLNLCLAEGVTRTFMVPQLVRGLIEEMVGRDVRVPSLKGIHYGAAPMDPPLLKRGIEEIGCRFLQYFGMTEMSGTISILPPGEHDLSRPHLLGSVGRALPGSAIEIRDPAGHVVSSGEAGEIWTAGPTMMLGYLGRADLTAEAIVEGWYRTGDGGKLDEEGFLYLTDRIKDMIVTGGENVYPAEVETVLREHPAVADCAVYGLPDKDWGEKVCAAIEIRAGQSALVDEVMSFMKGQIAGYKVPKHIVIVEALPRTASGKIQRGKVKQTALESA